MDINLGLNSGCAQAAQTPAEPKPAPKKPAAKRTPKAKAPEPDPATKARHFANFCYVFVSLVVSCHATAQLLAGQLSHTLHIS